MTTPQSRSTIAKRAMVTTIAALLTAAPLAAQITRGEPKPAEVYLIKNATVVPVNGPKIEKGSVLMRNGKIEAVGTNLTAPAGAQVIDATGLFVYPGFIDSGTQIGLSEIGSVPGGEDKTEVGNFNPHNVAVTAVNPYSELIPVARYNGITTALTAPSGGLVSGTASLIDLAGWTGDQMAVKARAGLVVNYPRVGGGRGGRGGGGGGRGGGEPQDANAAVTQLRDYFNTAKAYLDVKTKLAAGAPGKQVTDLPMEAMIPALKGEVPVIFEAESEGQIRGALAFAEEFKLRPVIRGAREAWRMADELAAKKIPVIVGPTYAEPDPNSPYDEVYANAGVLAKAGVAVSFQTSGESNVRDLPFEVGLAEGFGLSHDDALKAVTINAAKAWGVDDKIGSIEAGKVANLFISTGDPMDPRSNVKFLFIRGELIPLVDRHTKFYEESKARPLPIKP
jgi:imidazolonepropionase-like amidohydrolase